MNHSNIRPRVPPFSAEALAPKPKVHVSVPSLSLPVSGWVVLFAFVGLNCSALLITGYEALVAIAIGGIILNAVLLAVALNNARKGAPLGKCFFVFGVIMFFQIEAVVSALGSPAFEVSQGLPIPGIQYSEDLVSLSFTYIALFELGFFVAYALPIPSAQLLPFLLRRSDAQSHWKPLALAVLALFAYLPPLAVNGFDPALAWSRLVLSYKGYVDALPKTGIVDSLAAVGLFASSVLLCQALDRKGLGRFWRLACALVGSLPVLMLGNRHALLYLLIPPSLVVWNRAFRRRSLSVIVKLCLATLVLLLIARVQLAVREKGWDRIGEVTISDFQQSRALKQYDALIFALYLVPDSHPYFKEFMTPFFVSHWVPRAFWPGKPFSEAWKYYNDAYVRGSTQWNATPSIIGQYHISWGIIGIFCIGAWLGILMHLADSLVIAVQRHYSQRLTVFVWIGFLYAFVIASFRFYAPYYFAYTVIGYAVMWFLTVKTSRRVGLES
jgi:hypothetical protein